MTPSHAKGPYTRIQSGPVQSHPANLQKYPGPTQPCRQLIGTGPTQALLVLISILANLITHRTHPPTHHHYPPPLKTHPQTRPHLSTRKQNPSSTTPAGRILPLAFLHAAEWSVLCRSVHMAAWVQGVVVGEGEIFGGQKRKTK